MEKTTDVLLNIGAVTISQTVVTTWVLTLLMALGSWATTRRLSLTPGPIQVVLEGAIEAIENAILAVLPGAARDVFPLILSELNRPV